MSATNERSGARWRITLIYIGMAVLFFGALGRVFAISVLDHEDHAERSRNNSITKIPVLAERGRIFSSDGQVLAQSIFSGTSVFVNARVIPEEQRYQVAKTLAEAIDEDPAKIYAKLTKHAKNAGLPIKHFVHDEAGVKVRQLIDEGQLPGVHFRDRRERQYPKKTSAGQLLGGVNLAGVGIGGIELAYDSYLRGEDGQHSFKRDARHRGIATSGDNYRAPQDGADVRTTIDSTIQEFAESAIQDCVDEWKPEAAMCVVMESKTGRVLAMANYPSFDPARYHKADQEAMKNRALTDAFEPGSIFKPLLYSAAFEEGLISKNSIVPYRKTTRVGYRIVEDDYRVWPTHLRNADGSRNPKGKYIPLYVGLGKSLNVIANYIGQSLYAGKRYPGLKYKQSFVDPYEGSGRFAKWVDRFGFGQYSGIDIGGGRRESKGITPRASQWDPESKPKPFCEIVPTLSMGYGLQVTGIQMLSCFNAIANDGKRMRPYVVESITSREGEVILEREPEVYGDSGLSAHTTKQTREILEWIVDHGTARRAKQEDYRIGGKTGTAKLLDPNGKYSEWRRRCSFISIGPIDNPELTILLSVQAASKLVGGKRVGKNYSGGRVAAPFVGDLMRRSLHHRGVEPSKQTEKKD